MDHLREKKKKKRKSRNTWRPKKKKKKHPQKPHNDPESLGHSKSSSKKEVYSNTCLSQEIKKKS